MRCGYSGALKSMPSASPGRSSSCNEAADESKKKSRKRQGAKNGAQARFASASGESGDDPEDRQVHVSEKTNWVLVNEQTIVCEDSDAEADAKANGGWISRIFGVPLHENG